MAEGKRYFWLRLHDDFFDSLRIKKLRRMAGGDTYTIIYLKMQLKAIKTEGVLRFTGLEEDFASELALDLDESVDDVRVTLAFLQNCGLIECSDSVNFFLPYAVANTGSETSAAKRMREMRQKDTQCIEESSSSVTSANNVRTMCEQCYGEIEKKIDIEKEKRRDIDRDIDREEIEIENRGLGEGADAPSPPSEKPAKPKPVRHKHGHYDNVLLSDEQFEKLKTEFPNDWNERIEKLSAYIASTGKSYKDHLATIRNWDRMEKEREKKERDRKGYDGTNVFLAIGKEEGWL